MADVGKVAVQERYGSGWSRPTRECPPSWKNNNPHTRLEADYQHYLNTVESLEKQLHELEAKRAAITAFHQYRSENPAISYTPEAWRALVDHATIHPGGTIAIALNDG